MSILPASSAIQQDQHVDWDALQQRLSDSTHTAFARLIAARGNAAINASPTVQGYTVYLTYTRHIVLSVYVSRVGSDSFIFSIESVLDAPVRFTWRGDKDWAAAHMREIEAAVMASTQSA